MKIQPFRGLRPQQTYAENLASHPYDVVSDEEVLELTKNNPLSILNVTRADAEIKGDASYSLANDRFMHLKQEFVLQQDDENSLYVYQIKNETSCQTGIMTLLPLDDDGANRIRTHEFTTVEKENDRCSHIQTLRAQIGPVFCFYQGTELLKSSLTQVKAKKPEYCFIGVDGNNHTFWKISGEWCSKIENCFNDISNVYVADGHHRLASAKRVGEGYVFTALVDAEDVNILAYNRLVKSLNGLSETSFLEKLSEDFDVEPSDKSHPVKSHHIKICLKGGWFNLQPLVGKMNLKNDTDMLDVSIVQKYIFQKHLGINDPRRSKELKFVSSKTSLEPFIESHQYAMGVSLYPVTWEQIKLVADQSMVMPPKSTWFEPKFLSGLVLYVF